MAAETLRFSLEGQVAHIVLSNPDGGNAIDRALLDDLSRAVEGIVEAGDVLAVVIEADGPDFCRGWNAAARAELLHLRARNDAASLDPFGSIARLACPVIAALQGTVASAGLELALCADIRIAAEDARFSMPEVGDGLLPLAGGSQRLSRIAGRSAASAILLLGEEIDAATALSTGLVSRIVKRDDLHDAAQALTERIASRGPIALRYAKEAVHNGLDMTLDQALRLETDLSVLLQTTQDRAEGVRAFREKRDPRFTAR